MLSWCSSVQTSCTKFCLNVSEESAVEITVTHFILTGRTLLRAESASYLDFCPLLWSTILHLGD
jgi:hypothetical protein